MVSGLVVGVVERMWGSGGERLQAEAGAVLSEEEGLAAAGRLWNSAKSRREQWQVVREAGVLVESGLAPAWREGRGLQEY
jgi:hypothetical protein